MIDEEEAIWMAELIVEAITNIEDNPGVTVEVDGNLDQWVQILFDQDDDGVLAGFKLNFPYRGHAGDPVLELQRIGLILPPNTLAVEWEDGGFATIWIRPDAPVVALAHFIGDIIGRVTGAKPGASISVQIEYGF